MDGGVIMGSKAKELERRILHYLDSGGLFNPELMDHSKVRDLLRDCLTELRRVDDDND